MQPSSYADIIRRLRELGPFIADNAAIEALSVTLGALSAALPKGERETLGHALPSEIAQILRGSAACAQESPANAFQRLLSGEHTAIVCRTLSEVLTPTARTRLVHALPGLSELLELPVYVPFLSQTDDPSAPARHTASCGLIEEREARALGTAQPGRRRPLSGP